MLIPFSSNNKTGNRCSHGVCSFIPLKNWAKQTDKNPLKALEKLHRRYLLEFITVTAGVFLLSVLI